MDVDQRRAVLAGAHLLHPDLDLDHAVVLDVLRRAEDRLGGPHRPRGVPETALRHQHHRSAVVLRVRHGPRRDRDGPDDGAVRADLSGVRVHAELAQAPARRRRRFTPERWIPVGARMAFTKTEVDIHDDYVVEAVDAAWLAQGVKSPKHLMLD